jgi:trans-aconitate 2-methyltransferase
MRWDAAGYDGRHSFVWEYGEDLLPLLDAKPEDRVLDVGCGTGHLTAKIAETGAAVTGIDNSPQMVEQARQHYPYLRFELQDAASFRFDEPFTAVFSNAALHWVLDAESAVRTIAVALQPGGRFVAELGGRGNIASLVSAASGILGCDANRWYYPSVAEYATLLERHGLEVRLAVLFDRPTELAGGESGLRDWIAMFGGEEWTGIAAELEEAVRPALFREGTWRVDYRRLRVVAVRT